MTSEAENAAEYLKSLPDERRQTLELVREVIVNHLPAGYEEALERGWIVYRVPLELGRDPDGGSLKYVRLGAEGERLRIRLDCVGADPETGRWFDREAAARGAGLDDENGFEFGSAAELPLELIGEAVARFEPEEYARLRTA